MKMKDLCTPAALLGGGALLLSAFAAPGCAGGEGTTGTPEAAQAEAGSVPGSSTSGSSGAGADHPDADSGVQGGSSGRSSGSSSGAGGSATGSSGSSSDSGGSSSASTGASPGAGDAGPGNPPGLWTIVNHPCYQWGDVPASNVPWTHLTHLILGYLLPMGSGTSYTLDVPSGVCGDFNAFKSNAAPYVDAGHKAGKKVSIQLGGAGGNPGNVWNTATDSSHVAGFAQNIVTMMKGMGIDGVDLDWEDNLDKPKVIQLAKELRSRWPSGVLTLHTGPTGADAVDLAGAKDSVDAFEPMTYMVVQQWGGWHIPVPLTPLFAYPSNSYAVDIVRKSWSAAGVPESKLIMGVGGYGTAWTDTNGDGHAPVAPYTNTDINGPADSETAPSFSDNAVTQKWLDKALAAHADLVEGWDDVGKCSYWHAPDAGHLVTVDSPSGGGTVNVGAIFYETARSMGEKVQYVNANGMKGFMFWTLSELVDGTSSPVLEAL